MSITLPKPGVLKPFLTKPKIPGLLAIGLLAAQYVLLGPGTSPEPSCKLNVEYIHASTHLIEQGGKLALKLNITSECNIEQKSTTLDARIDQIIRTQQTVAKEFKNTIAVPSGANQKIASFLDLIVECDKSTPVLYGGYAEGEVLLKDGRKVPVKGFSKKFNAVPCTVKAK